ncbi:hypothetical protein [Alienimonas chondri]|nr:hypothetical protein [Alienimonas chondri]
MNDAVSPPTTTGRRTWRLLRTLALPWIVCGAALWALVGLTPDPARRIPNRDLASTGLVVSLSTDEPFTANPADLIAIWNTQAWIKHYYEDVDRAPVKGTATLGVLWSAGASSPGKFLMARVGLWWLIPFPLLWSGFHLWRWVRRMT